MSKTKKILSRNINGPSCDWRLKPSKVKKTSITKAICNHKGNYTWKGIKTEAYKSKKGDWNKIIRRVLIGDGVKIKSHLRYFEIAPGGQSSFEKHRHEHIVIGMRGEGRVRLDKRFYEIGFLDVVYVSSEKPHQFLNPNDEPFGFLCIVPSRRDKPVNLS